MKKIIKTTKLVFFRIKENPKALPMLMMGHLKMFVRRNFYTNKRLKKDRLQWEKEHLLRREELRKKMSPAKRRVHEELDIIEANFIKENGHW